VICYADRFTPKDEAARAQSEGGEARTVAFLKRFVVFNIDQCEGLGEDQASGSVLPDPVLAIAGADRIIAGSGADFRIGGSEAFYAPGPDFVQVPPQVAFREPINWYRTALHELGHYVGGKGRLERDQSGVFGSSSYACRGNDGGVRLCLAGYPAHGSPRRLHRRVA
jgi:antirestriction protein ArdC